MSRAEQMSPTAPGGAPPRRRPQPRQRRSASEACRHNNDGNGPLEPAAPAAPDNVTPVAPDVPSTPAAATASKPDVQEQHRMAAKQQAVATLQKFFFEELARGADANGAAAQALLRLGAQRSATPPVSAPEPKPQEEANEDQGDQPAEAVLPCTPPR